MTGDTTATARLLLARVLVVIRVLQLVPWPVALLAADVTGLQHAWLGIGTYVVLAAWTLTWSGLTLERKEVSARLAPYDAAIVGVCLVLAGLACEPGNSTSLANSAVSPAMGAALAAGMALRWLPAALVWAWLAATMLAGMYRGLAFPGGAIVAVTNIASTVGIGVIGALVAGYLVRRATLTDSIAAELAQLRRDARAATEAEAERQRERESQYRMLHDTVLSTLSALARGGVDIDDPAVRQRIASDADYLRSLVSTGAQASGNRLHGALAEVGRAQSALGLRVQVSCSSIPEVPEPVIDAVVAATREALNNVVKHSGVSAARVTARGDGERLTVTIADGGHGFDPRSPRTGTGIGQSIEKRLAGVGGAVAIDSAPGQGTTVELTWPR